MSQAEKEVGRPALVLAPAPGHEGDAVAASNAAYKTLELGAIWEILSVICFALSLVARTIARWIFPPPQPVMYFLFLPIVFVAGFAILGIFFGVVGSKGSSRSHRLGIARIGIFLNGVVLVFSGLLLLVFFLILPH